MSNPLLVFWAQLFGGRREPASRVPPRAHIESSSQASSTIFLVMRRMRTPLITLIVIFFISVVGLTLIPGVDPEGQPARLSLFESFYFMSYTATTIGFGELPWPFTAAQRLWVTFSIYLSVVGWAYAIGSMLTLLQDRSFRQALALSAVHRKVERLREPFLLMAGYGRAGELLAKAFDELGQQIVVIDESSDRVDALDLGAYHADIPGLAADAANPHHLSAAGLDHPFCTGVLALTNDDETNLAVTMTAALLRPELPVVARTISARDRGTDARLRHADGGQPVRPLRRAPAARAERAGVLPAAHLARGRAGRRAAGARPSAHPRSLGDVRLRPVRSGGHRGPARAGPRGHDHRTRRAWPAGTRGDHRRRVRPGCPGSGRTSRARSGWWPAPTTTRPTCRCWPPPAG